MICFGFQRLEAMDVYKVGNLLNIPVNIWYNWAKWVYSTYLKICE